MTEWEKIREAYITGSGGAAALAREFHLDRETISKRMEAEDWKTLRQKYRKGTVEPVPKDAAWEMRIKRVDALADALLTRLEQAVTELDAVTVSCRDKTKDEDGEKTRDYQEVLRGERGIVDRGGLKQLTAVLKDIKDVLMLRSEQDLREQEARIAKLQRDLERRDTEESCVIVTMEGESQDYAD